MNWNAFKDWVMIGLEGKVDKDGDGIASFSFEGQVKVTADGSEIVDELLKNSAILQRVKEKFGIK